MDGYMTVYTSLNGVYNFLSGNAGYGYTRESKDGFHHIQLSIPVNRIVVGEPQAKDGSIYAIEWRETDGSTKS